VEPAFSQPSWDFSPSHGVLWSHSDRRLQYPVGRHTSLTMVPAGLSPALVDPDGGLPLSFVALTVGQTG
jgi:hypothetical protein